MASTYPGTLDTFTDMGSTLNGPPTHSAVHALVHDALEAVQAELGTDPAGASATVKARLDALDSTVSTNASTASGAASTALAAGQAAAQGILALASNSTVSGSATSTVSDVPSASVTFSQVSGRYYEIGGEVTGVGSATAIAGADLQITDSSNNVLRAVRSKNFGSADVVELAVVYRYQAGSTGSVTFKLRALCLSGGSFAYGPPSGVAGYTGSVWMQMAVEDLGAV